MLSRRGFIAGLLASSAVVPVARTSPPIFAGKVGVDGGVRVSMTMGDLARALDMARRNVVEIVGSDYYAIASYSRQSAELYHGR